MRIVLQAHAFVAIMWAMLIAGGGLFTLVLGPMSAADTDALDAAALSALKAAVAVAFVAAWVAALMKANRWMFRPGGGSGGGA